MDKVIWPLKFPFPMYNMGMIMMTPYLYSKEYKEDMILLDKIISSIIGVKLFFIFTEFFYSGTCFLSFFFLNLSGCTGS